jgi:alpha-mannosidase
VSPREPGARLQAHVVSHTHWDREWYLPAGRFRQRLVALVDELLADDGDPGNFLLDGQVVVLEDYLEVRPDRRAELAARLRDRRLEAGPWYVLADELIPSGEALVRNLLAGRRVLRSLRAEAPRVLYSPDAFGHPAALPTIAAGFDLPLIVLWRGYGGARWPAGDVVRWRGSDGASALLYHLPRSGYEFASSLPADRAAAAERWHRMRAEVGARSSVGVVLLPNGADHHARQQLLPEAIDALRAAAAGDDVVHGSLGAFASAVVAAADGARLPEVRGELRDSYGYTWTLQGTFATRAHQKRANARAERLMLREAEPWSALARAGGAFSRRHLVEAAWSTLLRCHPHDTLCGCSVDAVAVAMDARLEDVMVQGRGIRDDAILDLIGHDAVAARTSRSAWREVVVVRNPAPRPRGGVAEVEVRRFLADVPVGPGSAHAPPPPRVRLVSARLDGGRIPMQVVDRGVGFDRVESPRHYPDNDLVEIVRAVAWLPPTPGYGTSVIPLESHSAERLTPPGEVTARGNTITNGVISLGVDETGAVHLSAPALGVRIPLLVRFEDVPDVGDLYTHSAGSSVATPATFLGAHAVHRGPLRGVVEGRWRVRLPPNAVDHGPTGELDAAPTPPVGAGQSEAQEITAAFTIDVGSEIVRIDLRGHNTARDHRLRIVFTTPVATPEVWAEAAFGPVLRGALEVPERDRALEHPAATAPLHRYVSVFGDDVGATLFSDGLAEYEPRERGIAVTLVRAVGELSRNDLPERPGHAGWPTPTPLAQCIGPFAARFGFLVHGPRSTATVAAIERAADDVLVPLTGVTLRSAIAVPPPTHGVELVGEGLAISAIKESEDGKALILRCVNLTEEEVAGRWVLGRAPRSAQLARLDEAVIGPAEIEGAEVRFVARARGVVTIRVA